MRETRRKTPEFTTLPLALPLQGVVFALRQRLSGESSNIFIVYGTSKCVVIDTGSAAHGENLYGTLAKATLVPTHIYLTHWHWDHAGGVHTFPNDSTLVVVAIHSADAERVRSKRDPDVEEENDVLHIPEFFSANYTFHPPTAVRTFDNDPELELLTLDHKGSTLRVIHTPGHTRGSCVFLYKHYADAAKTCLFTGDTLYKASRLLCTFADSNRRDLQASLRHIANVIRLEDVRYIMAGHYQHQLTPQEALALIGKFVESLERDDPPVVNVCHSCGEKDTVKQRLQACAGCVRMLYCGEACAERDWGSGGHHAQCGGGSICAT